MFHKALYHTKSNKLKINTILIRNYHGKKQ